MKLKENEISDSKFKIDHCAFHLEGRLTESGFKVIEIAARPAGGFITSHLIRLFGSLIYRKIIDVAIGNNVKDSWPDYENGNKNYAFIVYAHQSGLFKNCRSRFYYGNSRSHCRHTLKEEGDEVIMPPQHF